MAISLPPKPVPAPAGPVKVVLARSFQRFHDLKLGSFESGMSYEIPAAKVSEYLDLRLDDRTVFFLAGTEPAAGSGEIVPTNLVTLTPRVIEEVSTEPDPDFTAPAPVEPVAHEDSPTPTDEQPESL